MNFGKYRGVVLDNVDPEQLGRVTATVPDVLGQTPSSWAMPCLPWAGPQLGIFCVPPIGASVWIEFEGGDADHPIWTGCFYAQAGDAPTSGAGGLVIKTASGAMITIGDAGITLDSGAGAIIVLAGPKVDINGGALSVT
jgi:uncharacterized protein involved in type VI secretion and phage assembly